MRPIDLVKRENQPPRHRRRHADAWHLGRTPPRRAGARRRNATPSTTTRRIGRRLDEQQPEATIGLDLEDSLEIAAPLEGPFETDGHLAAGKAHEILGFAQRALGYYPWGLWVLGGMMLLAALLYLFAQLGQKLGAWQTFQLHQAYQTAMGRPIEVS